MMCFETLTYAQWDPTNPLTGDKPTITMPGIGRYGVEASCAETHRERACA